ncbi:hypothetical protein [Vibrio europaeus]|uniref:hypothetical protein n=1 Tax=Vibrio europaeus TaxID=300876 RepID=UPI00233F130B|nr:hypothetical protein [Vibrio europaeus]MDC5753608.1 hypothetical protein [Vibrio europaeus]MDC5816479.1 hypothetical protein [Vibrio europaeus]
MALSDQAMTDNICQRLEGKGFKVDGEFSRQRDFVAAIAEAVVEEIQSKAKAVVSGGSSEGKHSIE